VAICALGSIRSRSPDGICIINTDRRQGTGNPRFIWNVLSVGPISDQHWKLGGILGFWAIDIAAHQAAAIWQLNRDILLVDIFEGNRVDLVQIFDSRSRHIASRLGTLGGCHDCQCQRTGYIIQRSPPISSIHGRASGPCPLVAMETCPPPQAHLGHGTSSRPAFAGGSARGAIKQGAVPDTTRGNT